VVSYNRTFVDLGAGRDWWLMGSANCRDGLSVRTGLDFGGRYGSGKINFQEITHRTDVIGGVYAGIHADVEWPCGACMLSVGGRGEWSYSWSDILEHQNRADVQDVNVQLTFGVRY
jgi:hypothetical protein